MLVTIACGLAFGAALFASGLWNPYLMAMQFTLQRWNMVQTFITATGCSALAVYILSNLGFALPPPRSYSRAGILATPLDGNLIGGALLGTGMALAASCPGMVFVQLAMGVPSAQATLAGAIAGGIFWSHVLRPRVADSVRRQGSLASGPKTLAALFGAGRQPTFLVYVFLLGVAVVTIAGRYASMPTPVRPIEGGLYIGAAQLLSLLARGSLVGVSTCYEHVGDWAVYVLRGRRGPRPPTGTLVFAASITAGAWLLAQERSDLTLPLGKLTYHVATWKAFSGGALMAVGSRLGGGCSSGHGISGMALMSVASFVTMFAAFAAAIAVSRWG